MDIALTWRPTRFNGGPPVKEDGTLFDDWMMVGRVLSSRLDGNGVGAWQWSAFAAGHVQARFSFLTSGRTVTKEDAKAACEAGLPCRSGSETRWPGDHRGDGGAGSAHGAGLRFRRGR